MKKFVGSVNGESFNNKEDWELAARKAIKESDGNLAISSYYSYKDDDESEEEGNDNFVGTNEYFIGDRKPDEVNEDNIVYNVPDELLDKIKNSINKDSIKKKLEFHLNNLDRDDTLLADRILSYQTDIKSLEEKIKELNDKIKVDEESRKDLLGKKKYYDTIVNAINSTYVEEKVFNEEKKEEKKYTLDEIMKMFGSLSLYDTLKKSGWLN